MARGGLAAPGGGGSRCLWRRGFGTLGARVQEVERYILPRTILTVPVEINDVAFSVHVKVTKNSAGKVTNAKPEFEDVKIIAARCKIPVKRAMELVNAQVTKKTGGA
jgi:hypothetical protein